jgi:hypothetical protein
MTGKGIDSPIICSAPPSPNSRGSRWCPSIPCIARFPAAPHLAYNMHGVSPLFACIPCSSTARARWTDGGHPPIAAPASPGWWHPPVAPPASIAVVWGVSLLRQPPACRLQMLHVDMVHRPHWDETAWEACSRRARAAHAPVNSMPAPSSVGVEPELGGASLLSPLVEPSKWVDRVQGVNCKHVDFLTKGLFVKWPRRTDVRRSHCGFICRDVWAS